MFIFLSHYLPFALGQKASHLLLIEGLSGPAVQRGKRGHPGVREGLGTWQPASRAQVTKAVKYSQQSFYSEITKWFGTMLIFCKLSEMPEGMCCWECDIINFYHPSPIKETNQPPVFLQHGADKVLCLIRDVLKTLLIKLKVGGCHKSQSLRISVSLEGGFSTEPGTQINHKHGQTFQSFWTDCMYSVSVPTNKRNTVHFNIDLVLNKLFYSSCFLDFWFRLFTIKELPYLSN